MARLPNAAVVLTILLSLTFPAVTHASNSGWIHIDQVAPDSRTFITATLLPTYCGARVPTVKVTGSQIAIDVQYDHVVCIAAWVPIESKAKIGMLPGGVYDLTATGVNDDPIRLKVVVRGVDPFRVIPAGGPSTGGNRLFVTNDQQQMYESNLVSVTFGGVAITDFVMNSAGELWFDAPPHAPGDVEVSMTFKTPANKVVTYTSLAAYRYCDTASAPDPYATERLLFPVAFEGAGAYGSQWTTDSSIAISWTQWPPFASFWNPPCATCALMLDASKEPDQVTLDKVTSPAGRLVYVLRGTADALSPSLRIHDLGRQARSAGIDIPVVRERDFRPGVYLQNIPTDSRFRAMLRVWYGVPLDGPLWNSFALIWWQGKLLAEVPLSFSGGSATALPFASADLDADPADADRISDGLALARLFRTVLGHGQHHEQRHTGSHDRDAALARLRRPAHPTARLLHTSANLRIARSER